VYDAVDRRGSPAAIDEEPMTEMTSSPGAEPAARADTTVANAPTSAAAVAADEAASESTDRSADDHQGHGDDAEPLGRADWGAWTGGILGVAAGLLVAGCLWLSTSGL
jgi:hypothetical protein